jgi:hypothetical protein
MPSDPGSAALRRWCTTPVLWGLLPALVFAGATAPARAQVEASREPRSQGGGSALDAPARDPAGGDRGAGDDREGEATYPLVRSALAGSPLQDLRLGEARDGRAPRLQGWASFAFFSGPTAGGSSLLVAPSFGARLALTEEIDAAFDWTVGYGAIHVVGEHRRAIGEPEPYDERVERVEAGNPTLALGWTRALGRDLVLRLGVGVALPVAAMTQAPTDARTAAVRAASEVAHETMLGMHGALDPWRFLPERLAFFVPLRIAFGGGAWIGALDAAGGWTVPVLGGSGGSEGVVQLGGEVGVAIAAQLRAGVRASIVGWRIGGPVTAAACRIGEAVPRVQPALEPWMRVALGPAYGVLRATMDVGCDLGLGSATPVWTIHIGGGAVIERD